MPGGFDEDTAQMRVARFRDRALRAFENVGKRLGIILGGSNSQPG